MLCERLSSRGENLGDLDLERHEHDLLRSRIWELRGNLTAYDATYVALAEALDAPLFTMDARLQRAPGHEARIELLGPRPLAPGAQPQPSGE